MHKSGHKTSRIAKRLIYKGKSADISSDMEKISDAKEGDIPGKFVHLADSSADIEGHGKKQGVVHPLSKKKKVTNDFYNTPQHSSQPLPVHSSQSTPQQSSQSTPQHSSQSMFR